MLVPLSSGNCARHFPRNVAISSPFWHYGGSVGTNELTNLNGFAMPATIPKGVCYLYILKFHSLLLDQPFLSQFFTLDPLLLLALTIRQERRVDVGIFREFILTRVLT